MTIDARTLRLGRDGGILLVSLFLTACQEVPQMPAPTPPEVGVGQPVRREVTFFTENTGNTRAFQSVEIRARVAGVLESIHFEPSSVVKKGDLLFVIEPETYRAVRDQADAAVKAAQAEVARAESDLRRIEQAIKTNAVSQSDLDLARAKRDTANANLLSAKASLVRRSCSSPYTEVRSPLTGQIGRNLVDVGNVVGGGEQTLLATVNQIQPIHVYFDAPEEQVLRSLRSGDMRDDRPTSRARRSARTRSRFFVGVSTLTDEGRFPHEGRLDFIGNTVDSATGTIELRAVLENRDLLLFPGLFVRVRIPTESVADAILVDERAIGTDLGGRYVYVVGEGNVVEQSYVELGAVQPDGMIPVLQGLDGSETYIVDGLLRARPGMPVTPTEPVARD